MRTHTLFPGIALATLILSAANVSCAEPSDKSATMKGNAPSGQALFNGKGICHYCHGVDGVLDKKPSLKPDTAAAIAKLAHAFTEGWSPSLRKCRGFLQEFRSCTTATIRDSP